MRKPVDTSMVCEMLTRHRPVSDAPSGRSSSRLTKRAGGPFRARPLSDRERVSLMHSPTRLQGTVSPHFELTVRWTVNDPWQLLIVSDCHDLFRESLLALPESCYGFGEYSISEPGQVRQHSSTENDETIREFLGSPFEQFANDWVESYDRRAEQGRLHAIHNGPTVEADSEPEPTANERVEAAEDLNQSFLGFCRLAAQGNRSGSTLKAERARSMIECITRGLPYMGDREITGLFEVIRVCHFVPMKGTRVVRELAEIEVSQ